MEWFESGDQGLGTIFPLTKSSLPQSGLGPFLNSHNTLGLFQWLYFLYSFIEICLWVCFSSSRVNSKKQLRLFKYLTLFFNTWEPDNK